MDRVSSCNIYVVQQDTQCGLMRKFYLALFVSPTCFGPHRSISRSVLYRLYSQTLVSGNTRTTRHVHLDVSSSTHSSTTYQSLRIQLVQNAPDDGRMSSEICRAKKTTLCILLDYIYITRWYTVPTMSRFYKLVWDCSILFWRNTGSIWNSELC